jgi:phage-related protein
MPDDWKAMPTIGIGVFEIRIRAEREHRVCYVARFREGIYVLHAFEKKTQRTSHADVRLARDRLRRMLEERRLTLHEKESS